VLATSLPEFLTAFARLGCPLQVAALIRDVGAAPSSQPATGLAAWHNQLKVLADSRGNRPASPPAERTERVAPRLPRRRL